MTRPLWLDQHLKSGLKIPTTPESKLVLSTENGVPRFEVKPDRSRSIAQVHVMYSVDPDPQARFWRSAEVQEESGSWIARLPILSTSQPLFAFANVHYRLEKLELVPFAQPTSTFAISSLLHTATPEQLNKSGVKATDKRSLIIDDFSHDWRDWYLLSAENPHHWQYWTRKLSDPKWQGSEDSALVLDVRVETDNELVVVITKNFFRPYRGLSEDFVAVVPSKGSKTCQTVELKASDFQSTKDGSSMTTWQQTDLLGFRAYYRERKAESKFGTTRWAGNRPAFREIRWTQPQVTTDKFKN